MRVVTTCHRQGYETYGLRFVSGWQNWPTEAELFWYTEGFSPPPMDRTTFVPVDRIESLFNFKQRYSHYNAIDWRWDVVRFSNKVFAARDALYEYKGIGVWLDNDCVTFEKIPHNLIETLIPAGAYMGIFKRTGFHCETGFWVIDCNHEQHQAFLDTWCEWYTSNEFKRLPEWTDCHTLDATVRIFEKQGLIQTHNLSGAAEKDMHPLCHVELGKYIDHCKGRRKIEGYSPENKHHEQVRKAA